MAASSITLKQKEAKTLTLKVKQDGAAANLTGCTLSLGIKRTKADATYAISKADADFHKAQAAQGIISLFLTDTDLNLVEGIYTGELKISFPGSPTIIDKSADFFLKIKAAVVMP